MDAHKQTIIHHIRLLQEFRIPSELLSQQRPLLWAQLQHIPAIDPIQVLQDRPRVPRSLLLRVLPPHRASLQIIRLVDIPMGWEQIIHDHEMDLPSPGQLHAVQPIEARQQCVRVVLHVRVVVLQDGEEEFVLRVPDSFDDEAVVAGEVEEGA